MTKLNILHNFFNIRYYCFWWLFR